MWISKNGRLARVQVSGDLTFVILDGRMTVGFGGCRAEANAVQAVIELLDPHRHADSVPERAA